MSVLTREAPKSSIDKKRDITTLDSDTLEDTKTTDSIDHKESKMADDVRGDAGTGDPGGSSTADARKRSDKRSDGATAAAAEEPPRVRSTGRLRPEAPEFDVATSPHVDPYTGPLGVSTRGEYVPPAKIVKPSSRSSHSSGGPSATGVPPLHLNPYGHVRPPGDPRGAPPGVRTHSPHYGVFSDGTLPDEFELKGPSRRKHPHGYDESGSSGGGPRMAFDGRGRGRPTGYLRPMDGHGVPPPGPGGIPYDYRYDPRYPMKGHKYPPVVHVDPGMVHGGFPHGGGTPLGVKSGGATPRSDGGVGSGGFPHATASGSPPTAVPSFQPSSRGFGHPRPEDIDGELTNKPELQKYQRWELLESAKRWLPGEGTVCVRNGYRYILGAPIHMGMNGHIHYCYRYPITRAEKEGKGEASPPHSEEKDAKSSASSEDSEPTVETVAAKVVPNTSAFAREIVFLRGLQGSENICTLYEVLESKRTLISILELAQADVYNFFVGKGAVRHGWTLEKPAVREAFARMVVTNAVQGLRQMHEKGYLHCDLKSLNILLYIYKTDKVKKKGGVYMKAKLTDFGHSCAGEVRVSEKTFKNGMARVGTAGHVAPELFMEGKMCDYKIDIWSLGIVMFSMLVPGRLLFGEYTSLEELKKSYDSLHKVNPWSRENCPKWWTDFERLSPEARDLILWMTKMNPDDRPKIDDIMTHPWFLIAKGNLQPGQYRPKLKEVHKLCSSSFAQE